MKVTITFQYSNCPLVWMFYRSVLITLSINARKGTLISLPEQEIFLLRSTDPHIQYYTEFLANFVKPLKLAFKSFFRIFLVSLKFNAWKLLKK